MNIYFYTLGCKVNQYESQLLFERFSKEGYTLSKPQNADVIVVNSCTVTAESDRKVRQALRRFRRISNAVIVLCGCLAQAGGDINGLADIITGNNDNEKIVSLVNEFKKNNKKQILITPHTKGEPYPCGTISSFCEHTRAFMKIEDGCDNFCTYCIIPFARGRVRSRSPESIKAEAESLAANGYREIVLVGINLCNYGKGESYNLCDAVDAVASVNDILRIRLGSLEPDYLSDSDLDRLAACKKFCPNFHLSLQSGCSETLKRMNRHYDAEFYKNLVTKIRNHFDHVSISTDIMCGFAGETQEEFEKSIAFFKDIGFARAHVFAYSRRPGTFAAKYENQIPEHIKKERSKILCEAAAESEAEYIKNIVGKERTVLFETAENGFVYGYTDDYIRVCVPYADGLLNKVYSVTVTKAEKDFCRAIINI